MKRILTLSTLVLVMCLCLIVGGTYALFTSSVKEDITVSTADVKVTSAVDAANWTLYSAQLKSDVQGDPDLMDASQFESVALTSKTTFTAGGQAKYENKTVTFTNFASGDGAEFAVKVTNSSTIKIYYRVKLAVDKTGMTEGQAAQADALLGALEVGYKLNGANDYTSLTGNVTSAWATCEAGGTIGDIGVKIILPVSVGNTVGDYTITLATLKINVVVEAVQYTGALN